MSVTADPGSTLGPPAIGFSKADPRWVDRCPVASEEFGLEGLGMVTTFEAEGVMGMLAC
jgi:hypothetical protein